VGGRVGVIRTEIPPVKQTVKPPTRHQGAFVGLHCNPVCPSSAGMDLETARRHIQTCLDRMRALYLRPVFDEWAILALTGKTGAILAYQGPRPDLFRKNLATDVEPLRSGAAGKSLADGDMEFASDAAGTKYDALIKSGTASYLVLNHTVKSMTEIRSDPKWLAAQKALFELSEKFRADPLETLEG
jgi:hypothetical protein